MITRTLAAATALALGVLLPSLPTPALAQQAGGPTITEVRVRATAPGAPVAAAYLRLEAGAKGADKLVAVKVDPAIAGVVEIHDMFEEAGMMKMRRIDGVVLEPGSPAELKPGGKHVMMMNLKQQMKAGDTVKLVLVFEKAGEIAVDAKVVQIGPGASAPAKSGGHGPGGHGAH